jgi:hypothetical protein
MELSEKDTPNSSTSNFGMAIVSRTYLGVVEMSSNVRLKTKGFEIERLNYLNTSPSNEGHGFCHLQYG